MFDATQPASRREDRAMTMTRRAVGIGAVIVLAVLGTGWALEKAASSSRTHGGAGGIERTRTGDTAGAPRTGAPPNDAAVRPTPTTDSIQEHDRSDLILVQG
jgi:hypothetical protein